MFYHEGSRPLDYSTAQRMVEPPSPMGIPVHPDVRLKHLPFYDCVTELMKPTSLGKANHQGFIWHLLYPVATESYQGIVMRLFAYACMHAFMLCRHEHVHAYSMFIIIFCTAFGLGCSFEAH